MSGVMEGRMGDGDGGDRSGRSGAPDGRPKGSREVRWRARRKQQVVLRLLRGESLDALARETGQPAGTISGWREAFLEGGQEGLKSRPRPVEERPPTCSARRSSTASGPSRPAPPPASSCATT